jgi:2OG-Fe(II) oxygenase superfamily
VIHLFSLVQIEGTNLRWKWAPRSLTAPMNRILSLGGRVRSTQAWCLDECVESAVTQTVIAKIENLTGIPDANAEFLQLLRYEEGQFYQQHHDYKDFHLERAHGVRILTVFLYLNDVEEGTFERFACSGSVASLRNDLTK